MSDKEIQDLRDVLSSETDRAIALAGRVVDAERQLAEARAGQAVAEAREEELRKALAGSLDAYHVACRLEGHEAIDGHPLDPRFLKAQDLLSTPAPPASELLKLVGSIDRWIADSRAEAEVASSEKASASLKNQAIGMRIVCAELRRAIGLPAKEKER